MAKLDNEHSGAPSAAKCTSILPPLSAVRMVWAMTGAFSNDKLSTDAAKLVTERLKDITERVAQDPSAQEQEYVRGAITCMEATVRSLDTVYKGRELNFKDSDELRTLYLESVKGSLDFGEGAKDFLKSLPGLSIGGAGGLTLASMLQAQPVTLWGVGITLAGVGYVVNALIVQYARKQRQLLYVRHDYDRDVYYDRYISQVSSILTSLYLDIDRLHKNTFGQAYPVGDPALAQDIVENFLKGVRPAFCPNVHKHMQGKKITPEIWSRCEAGGAEAMETCALCEGGKP